jgi:hypothetical protein
VFARTTTARANQYILSSHMCKNSRILYSMHVHQTLELNRAICARKTIVTHFLSLLWSRVFSCVFFLQQTNTKGNYHQRVYDAVAPHCVNVQVFVCIFMHVIVFTGLF